MEKEDVMFLSQLVKALEDSELKLEQSYNEKDYKNFDNIKKFMLIISGKISEVVE